MVFSAITDSVVPGAHSISWNDRPGSVRSNKARSVMVTSTMLGPLTGNVHSGPNFGLLHCDDHAANAGDEVNGTAHALDHLAGDHPVGDAVVGADFHRAEHCEVDMTTADPRKTGLWTLNPERLIERMRQRAGDGVGGLMRRENWISDLPGLVQRAIRARMSTIMLRPGDTLQEAGKPPTHLYELEDGFLKLCRLRPDGGVRFLALYAPGSAFGETALVLSRRHHQHSSIALAASRVRSLPAEDFRALCTEYPEIPAALCFKFAGLVGDLLQRGDQAVTTRLRSRVAAMLSSLGRDLGRPDADGRISFTLPISHSDIAQHVDATRQAVQRELAMLAQERLVERHGNRWTLADIGRLQSV